MADVKVTIKYVQQEQHPGGWMDHAETEDRDVAMGRSNAFAAGSSRANAAHRADGAMIIEGAPAPAKGIADACHAAAAS